METKSKRADFPLYPSADDDTELRQEELLAKWEEYLLDVSADDFCSFCKLTKIQSQAIACWKNHRIVERFTPETKEKYLAWLDRLYERFAELVNNPDDVKKLLKALLEGEANEQ